MASTELAELSRRVQLLEDLGALRPLMIRGRRALDYKDFDTWIDCWTEDATFHFGPWGVLKGCEEIRARIDASETLHLNMIHQILNSDFQIDGDTATGIGFMWFVRIGEGQQTTEPYSMGGPYEWNYRRDPDRWRISAIRLGLWYSRGQDSLNAFTKYVIRTARNGETHMRTVKFGTLEVSAQGLGCMGMSEYYGPTD